MLVNPNQKTVVNVDGVQLSTVSVDCVIFGLEGDELKVLLIQHDEGPVEGQWALPGDYVRFDIDLEEMPSIVLKQLTGLENVFVELFDVLGKINRVTHQRVITAAYFALISTEKYELKKGLEARDIQWMDIHNIPKLIYDHNEIINRGYEALKLKLRREPVGVELLPRQFTLTQFQKMYETILDIKLDTRNFRKKILKEDILIDTNQKELNVPYRAPNLYTFNAEKYDTLKAKGYFLNIY
ncbi:MAG: NUDIX hydrolase [Saprospiraceae bacterium]|nr:NUDIX hydrolase [Saprospiraceae bacterium]